MSCDSRVVDPETLQEVPPGEQGEIVMHGPMVFDGYWKRPDATAAAFIELDGKRFFRSGDLGRMDEDGYFFITDRLKRMINASGFKVWPAEVEALMFRHPAIQEACVISAKDAYRGETVKAVVVLRASHKGPGRRAGHRRLVPREHGRLQGAAHRAVRRRLAQERQRQGDVAQPAGGRSATVTPPG
jgi:fatty-acyl-CoA synthase